ncbi:phosphoribosylglycinamide formyltransferase [Chloroflexota bacterium]
MYKIGWFSTGRGEGSKGLLRATRESIKSGELEAEIEFIFCSRERGQTEATDQYLKMVDEYGIPLVSFSYRRFKAGRPDSDEHGELLPWRLEYDREIMARIKDFSPDLCVLAGYMLIVGPEMCRKYNMINLHPATPGGPTGTWQEVIWKLIEGNADSTGSMMHLVIPELDKGPSATYCTFSIRGKPFDRYWYEVKGQPIEKIKREQDENNPLFKLIRQYGYARELPLIIATLKAFSQGKVKITRDKQIVDASGRAIDGYDLTAEIDTAVKNSLPH